ADKDTSAPSTKKAYERARELLGGTGDMALRVSAFYGLWVAQYVGGDSPASLEAARAFLAATQNDAQDTGRLVAHRAIGMSLAVMGELTEARHHLEQTLAMHDAE